MKYQGSSRLKSSCSKCIPELLDDLGDGDGTAQHFGPLCFIILNMQT